VAITSTGSVTNVANQTITGTGEAGTTVKLYDNGSTIALATATVAANGTWSAEVTLSGQGTHSLVATDTDAAGNVGISSEVLYKLGILSQVGKDTLTGGAGHDLFIYTATNQSMVKAADVIQNFTHGEDDIDLSAIAGIGDVQGPLKAASIKVAAHSVAWTVDKSGDTQVYVNTTDNAEFQPQAQMKIVLTGHPTLDAGDFVLV
jgi:Ca2+-binding RTX toxin-like protein